MITYVTATLGPMQILLCLSPRAASHKLFVPQGREETKDRSVPHVCGRHPKTDTRWHEQTGPDRTPGQVIHPLYSLNNAVGCSSGGPRLTPSPSSLG